MSLATSSLMRPSLTRRVGIIPTEAIACGHSARQARKKESDSGFANAPALPNSIPQIALRTAISDSLPLIVRGRSGAS